MTTETPIELLHLPEHLRRDFTGKLPEAVTGSLEERERNFLSRALAAYAVEAANVSRVALELAEALWTVCEAKGFVSRRTSADVGAEAYEQARHFRSVFSAASDCQILRSGLLAKLAEPPPQITGATQPPEAAPQEVKSEP
jgi:hypothetical protein